MRGLGGNDTYFVDSLADRVDESVAGSGGKDIVRSSLASVSRTQSALRERWNT